MAEYPKVGDKVVPKQPKSTPRTVVTKVNSDNDLIEIRTVNGACGSHIGLEKFESNYTKVE